MHGPGAVFWIGHSLCCSGRECWVFGHGLLLDCEALRSRPRPLCGSVTPAFATSSVDKIAFARDWARMECIHPLRDDFGSIAVIAPVLLQSPKKPEVIQLP